MRILTAAVFLFSGLAAGTEREVIDTVQRTFNAMAAKDEASLRKIFVPDARLFAVKGTTVTSTSGEQFASRIASMAEPVLERMWNPKVTLQGKIAVLWTEYDFYRSGKFSHCGIDVVTFVQTGEGWKITSIQYSAESAGCKPSPLGPPKQ